nr:hypothetical protein [Candidatus Njordarchaeum guaymaensis]
LETSTTVFVDKAKIVTANYEIHYLIQYYLALETSPLGIYSPSGSGWYYEGNRVIISTAEYIAIIPGLSRYRFVGWTTGDMNEIADPLETSTTVFVDKAKTVTANYVVQYAITFDQTGLSSSATGSVLTIDSTTKTFADLPYPEWVDSGKTVTYSYSNPVTSSILGEQFWLKSVSGLSSPFIVDKACTIIGKYLALPLSVITDSCLGYFDEDEQAIGQQFTLIFVQISANTYMLVVSNPWQVYYNVFYVGKPGDLVDLTVTIPYPFVTRGFVPVNVYSYVSIDNYGRFRPSGRVTSEFAITGPSTTPYGAAGISLGDYTGSFESTVNIEVTGVVPSSGLVYVMVSLDYGLEWTWGYGVDSDGNAIVLRTNDLFIENGESYIFSYTVDGSTYMQIIESENVFIRFPWLICIFADS